MTIQSYKLLQVLKRIQKDEDGNVGVTEDGYLINIREKGEDARIVDPASFAARWSSLLDSLQRDGLLEVSDDHETIHVTHEGFHVLQKLIWDFCRSIVIPCIVALLTALITLWIKGK